MRDNHLLRNRKFDAEAADPEKRAEVYRRAADLAKQSNVLEARELEERCNKRLQGVLSNPTNFPRRTDKQVSEAPVDRTVLARLRRWFL